MYSNVLLCFFALAIVAPQSAHAQYPVGPNWPTVDGQGSRGEGGVHIKALVGAGNLHVSSHADVSVASAGLGEPVFDFYNNMYYLTANASAPQDIFLVKRVSGAKALQWKTRFYGTVNKTAQFYALSKGGSIKLSLDDEGDKVIVRLLSSASGGTPQIPSGAVTGCFNATSGAAFWYSGLNELPAGATNDLPYLRYATFAVLPGAYSNVILTFSQVIARNSYYLMAQAFDMNKNARLLSTHLQDANGKVIARVGDVAAVSDEYKLPNSNTSAVSFALANDLAYDAGVWVYQYAGAANGFSLQYANATFGPFSRLAISADGNRVAGANTYTAVGGGALSLAFVSSPNTDQWQRSASANFSRAGVAVHNKFKKIAALAVNGSFAYIADLSPTLGTTPQWFYVNAANEKYVKVAFCSEDSSLVLLKEVAVSRSQYFLVVEIATYNRATDAYNARQALHKVPLRGVPPSDARYGLALGVMTIYVTAPGANGNTMDMFEISS